MKPLTAMSPIVTLKGHQPTISMSGILQLLSNEKAIGGGIAYAFETMGLSGLSAGAWYTHGWGAINTSTNAGIPDRNELDLWIQYRPTEGPLKGFRLKTTYGTVWQQGNVRNSQLELQVVVDYTVLIRPPPATK